ncbi:MAG: Pr6Pr family membrane protein [Hyphomonadaceae bacterium]|nr:Pr6Pr family membrane protein [Hyphomonadaceae bacterium]
MSAVRIVSILGAVIGWTALILQLVLIMGTLAEQGPLFAVWRYLGFFTILTNIWCTILMTNAAIRPASRNGRLQRSELAAATAIVIVGIVYSIALRDTWNPQGWAAVADHLLHDISPIAFAVFWLLRPHGGLNWRDAALCVIWPVIYGVYALVRGSIDGWYAYWFLDPSAMELTQLLQTALALIVGFAAVGLVLITADRLLGRRAARPR